MLLRALLESEALHNEGPVGAAIECIFFSEGQDVELIKLTIAKAVELTGTWPMYGCAPANSRPQAEPELLFRQDSVYTDVASKFMRYHGAKYLHKALKTPITSLIQRVKAGEEFSIDASRSTPASAERLMQTTEEVLKSVIAKASIIPRYLCASELILLPICGLHSFQVNIIYRPLSSACVTCWMI